MSSRRRRSIARLRWKEFRIVFVLAAIALTLLPAPPAAAEPTASSRARNLLRNGSFERAPQGAHNVVPHGWSLRHGAQADVQIRRLGRASLFGNNVLQLAEPSTVEIESDFIEVVPGASYELAGWIREYAPDASRAYLYIKTFDADRKLIDYARTGNPVAAGWHRFSRLHRMPAGAVYAKIACRSAGDPRSAAATGGWTRFDGLAFHQAEPGDLLFKGAFDLDLRAGCCGSNGAPAGWSRAAGTYDPQDVAVIAGPAATLAFDDHDAAGRIVMYSPRAYVSPGVDYTASVHVRIDPAAVGQKGYVYLRFYDRNGTRLPTEYYTASAARGAYERLSVGGPAPPGAVHARILLATTLPGRGQVRMHSVALAESYDRTRWVAPGGADTGTGAAGMRADDPAGFNDPVFWNEVRAALDAGDSVRVVFKAAPGGAQRDYAVDGDGDSLKLDGIGSPHAHLLIEGESAHGVRFVRPDDATRHVDTFIVLDNAPRNVTLRNFVFQDLQTRARPGAARECGTAGRNHCIARPLIVNSGAGIRIENVSLQDLPNSKFGGITARLDYAGVWIADSDFIGTGLDHFAHSVYAQWGRDLVLSGNYSEDSRGTHFKLKGEITGAEVSGNEFVSTASGRYHPKNAGNHESFVYLNAEHVAQWPGWFGGGYRISGNRFDYRGGGDDNGRVAVAIGHGGCDPAWQGVTRRHLLTAGESDKVKAAPRQGADGRKEVLRKRFQLDFDDPASIYVGRNIRLNPRHHTRHIHLRSTWSGSPACTAGRVRVEYADLSDIDDD
jgi:hypothetical protein